MEVELQSFLASALDGHELSSSCHGCFTPLLLGQHHCYPLNGKLGESHFRGNPACRLDSIQTVLSQLQLKAWVINKVTPLTCLCRHRGEMQVQLLSIHNLALEGAVWSAPCSNCFTVGKDTTHCTGEWMGFGSCLDSMENLASTRIQSLDYPACSRSL